MSRQLEVLLHGQPVGLLTEIVDGSCEFRLLEAYRESVPRGVLGQKFEDDLDRVYGSRRGQRLPDFFANLIPERESRLRSIIVEAAKLESGDDLALLAFVGRDLPGAIAVTALEDSAPELSVPASMNEQQTEESNRLRFSLAGVQLKFSMLLKDNKLTLPLKDETGDWIVKFASPSFANLPENEFSMLEWARAADFGVPECQLRPATDVAGLPLQYTDVETQVLAIRRYDRPAKGKRVHQEDLAQAVGLPPERKYDQITYDRMALLARQFIGDDDAVLEMVRRLVLAIACGNNDAHLKNWSLIYPDGVRASWSPVYDQVATICWPAPKRELSLKLAGLKEFGRIDRAAFERFAQALERIQIDRKQVLRQVDETLERLRDAWQRIAPELPLPPSHAQTLREHWQKVPLLRAAGPLD